MVVSVWLDAQHTVPVITIPLEVQVALPAATVAEPPVVNPVAVMVTFWSGTAVLGDMVTGAPTISMLTYRVSAGLITFTLWVPRGAVVGTVTDNVRAPLELGVKSDSPAMGKGTPPKETWVTASVEPHWANLTSTDSPRVTLDLEVVTAPLTL
jgi:hypothetical protein